MSPDQLRAVADEQRKHWLQMNTTFGYDVFVQYDKWLYADAKIVRKINALNY